MESRSGKSVSICAACGWCWTVLTLSVAGRLALVLLASASASVPPAPLLSGPVPPPRRTEPEAAASATAAIRAPFVSRKPPSCLCRHPIYILCMLLCRSSRPTGWTATTTATLVRSFRSHLVRPIRSPSRHAQIGRVIGPVWIGSLFSSSFRAKFSSPPGHRILFGFSFRKTLR